MTSVFLKKYLSPLKDDRRNGKVFGEREGEGEEKIGHQAFIIIIIIGVRENNMGKNKIIITGHNQLYKLNN